MSDAMGSSMATAELHLKMSKKIAQLTKVIFHLNTRNEDFQTEFTHLKQVHAIEQQQLTTDAATKLRLLNDQLHTHQQDKQQVLLDLQVFQQQAATAQQTAQLTFQRRIQSLEEQVETSRRAFVDRIQQLTQMAETQQQRASATSSASQSAYKEEIDLLKRQHQEELDTLRRHHTEELDESKRKHSDEVEQVVMSSNARFTQMLGEQLQLQDALRSQVTTERTQWEATTAQQMQKQQLQWQQERDDLQRRFDETKTQWVGKMEQLLAEAETLRGHETRLRADKDDLLQTQGELQRQLKLLELQVSRAQHETQSVRKDTDVHTTKLRQTLETTQATIEQLTREHETLQTSLASRDVTLQHTIRERDALQLELLEASARLSELQAKHMQQLSERDLKNANLQTELSQQRQQTTAADVLNRRKLEALETRITELLKELDELQKKLSGAELRRAAGQKENDKVQSDLQAKLAEANLMSAQLRTEHAKTLEELKQSHTHAMEALVRCHAEEINRLQRDADARIAAMEATLTQHSSTSKEKALREMKEQHAQAIAQLQASSEAKAATWAKENAEKTAQVQAVENELKIQTTAVTQAQTKMTELTIKLKQCDDQLTQLQGENESLTQSTRKTQKERDEAFQKQLKELIAQHESVLKRLASEKDRLVLDHQKTLAQLNHEHTEQLAAAQRQWEVDQNARLSSQHDALTTALEQQRREALEELTKERAVADAAALAAKEQRQQLEESRASDMEHFLADRLQIVKEYEQRLTDLVQSHANTLETTIAAHTAAIDHERAMHAQAMDKLRRAGVTETDQLRAALTTEHQDAITNLRKEHADALTSLQGQRHSDALAHRAELARQLHDLRTQKDAEHTRIMADTIQTHVTQVDALQRELADRSSQLSTAQSECESLHQTLETTVCESRDRVAALERRHRDDVERIETAAHRELNQRMAEHVAELTQVSERFEEARRMLNDRVASLTRTILEWEAKYARRESRPEDVARIAQLEAAVDEKEAFVRQTLDEMAYFKRELLNREEMYNKTFARTPNVGVLNVLKPHVLRQAQMHSNSNAVPPITSLGAVAIPPASQQSARRPKLQKPEDLQRRGSERGTPGAVAARKALPPLGNNNQAFGL